jgi:hypothetical protein
VCCPNTGTPPPAELLRRAPTAASRWGSDTFTAVTSPANGVIHPRMERLDAEPLRGTIRFVRPPPQARRHLPRGGDS